MQEISDILLGLGAIGVAIYCHVLARRLRAFNRLENGIGGAVAVMSMQVDELTRALGMARSAAQESTATLAAQTERAEQAAAKLELMLATLHDLPGAGHPAGIARRSVRHRGAVRPGERDAA